MVAELESPGQPDREQHADGRGRQRNGNSDPRRDLPPQDAADRHAAHEHDDESGESARTHPRRQRHLGRDLQCRQNRDPRDAGGQHRDGQQTRRSARARARAPPARRARSRPRPARRARFSRAPAAARTAPATAPMPMHVSRQTVDFRAAAEFAPHDEREQRPRRAGKHEEGAATDQHDLQRPRVHDEAHADANRAQKALGRQRTLVVLAPPPQQHRKDADVRQRVEHEHEPGPTAATSTPAIAGPIARDTLIATLLSAMAAGISSAGTSRGRSRPTRAASSRRRRRGERQSRSAPTASSCRATSGCRARRRRSTSRSGRRSAGAGGRRCRRARRPAARAA